MDPLIYLIICCGFAGLFLSAGLKKALSYSVFQATVESYQILPNKLIATASILLIVVEFTLSGMWIIASLRPMAAIGSSILLAVYAFAIGVNLKRARSHISCGCGWTEQQLSWSLVIRNCIYILLVLATLTPTVARGLNWIDFALGIIALTVAVLLNRCADTLIANNANIASWRQ